jgi:hypothetical protein
MDKRKISGKQSGPDYRTVSPDKLLFDVRNPRFGGHRYRLTQPQMQDLLEKWPHLAVDLVRSFVQNGFVPYEPLVVRQEGKSFVVIEGNRRLAAIRNILSNRNQYPKKVISALQTIPVIVFHEKPRAVKNKEIHTYLGIRHLLGFREWPAESKAIFLDRQIKTKGDLQRIMGQLDIKKGDIARYLIPYRVRQKTQPILEDLGEIEDKGFWVLGEALRRSGIKEYIKLKIDPKNLKVVNFDRNKFRYLLEFLYGSSALARKGRYKAIGAPRISETRQLTRLGRVLSKKRAAEQLEKGSTLEEAELYVETREETIQSLVDELRALLMSIVNMGPTKKEAKTISKHFRNFEAAVEGFATNDKRAS